MGWLGDAWDWMADGVTGIYEDVTGVTAANIQGDAAQAGIDETRRQFEAMQELLSPYVQAGTQSLTAQQDLAGLNGPEAQAAALQGISSSPEMLALTQQGENAILQQGSATGGLRGGNVQGALAQFRPQALSSLINQQYSRLGGITQMGQASAAGVGAAGMQTGAQVADLLGQQGQAAATANLNAWAPVRTGIQLATGYGLSQLGMPSIGVDSQSGYGAYSQVPGVF